MTKNSIIRKCSTILALSVILAVLLPLVACAKEPVELTGTIRMTTRAPEVRIVVDGAENIAINWGDGRVSNVSDVLSTSEVIDDAGTFRRYNFSQIYSDTRARNIVITGNVTSLTLNDNQLTALDVSGATTLEHLNVSNNQLTALDVSRNTALISLVVSWNQLTRLDVSGAKALTHLSCRSNQLTAIDLSRNDALEQLWLTGNQLTSLDVSRNTALVRLELHFNQLTSLDVSRNTALLSLCVAGNQFTASALNDLFRTLPRHEPYGGSISINTAWPQPDDPVFEADRSIAEERGWTFRACRL